jgi:glutamyl-tRNA reductase
MDEIILYSWNIKDDPNGLNWALINEEKIRNEIIGNPASSDFLVLKTCNRLEYYLKGKPDRIIHGFEFSPVLYRGDSAIEHLFMVSGGLDSISIGESEILAQIKEAYGSALRESHLGKDLQLIFRMAISAGKLSRTMTGISRGKTSIATLSIDIVKNDYDIEQMRVLIIGTGRIARKFAVYLRETKVKAIAIMGRNKTEGMGMARDFSCDFLDLSLTEESLKEYDLIVTATSSTSPILLPEHFANSKTHFVLLDASNPPNVDPAVSAFKNVKLYSFHEIEGIIRKNSEKKRNKITQSKKIIVEQVKTTLRKLKELEADSMVEEYVRYSQLLTDGEVNRAIESIKKGAPLEKVLSKMSGSISKKLARPYILAVKEASRSEMSENLTGLKAVLSKIDDASEDH